eukprot:5801423-Prymnesium_polylepis.1
MVRKRWPTQRAEPAGRDLLSSIAASSFSPPCSPPLEARWSTLATFFLRWRTSVSALAACVGP